MSMIVCPEPAAAEAGAEVLALGGNAADVAVAAGLVEAVVNPFMCSLSGTAILLHRDAFGRTTVLNGEAAIGSGPIPEAWREADSPRAESIGRFQVPREENQIGPTSAMVPGFVALLGALHRRFGSGRLSWPELVAPARRLAADGFAVTAQLARTLAKDFADDGPPRPGYPDVGAKFARDPLAGGIFLTKAGGPLAEGEMLRQPDLAATLDRLAHAGASDFYEGDISREMARDLADRGSLVTRADLTAYRVVEQTALTGTFRGTSLLTTPPPSPGVQVLEMLAILDSLRDDCGLDVAALDDAGRIGAVARVMRAGFADNRDIKAVPLDGAEAHACAVMDPARIHAWARRIASGASIAGAEAGRGTGTTHLVVVDVDGAALSLTHSVGSTAGSGAVTPGLGFLHNNFLGHFDPRPGRAMSIVPGRRIGSGMPTVALEGDALRLVIGAPGGSRIITSIFQVLVDVLARRVPLAEAVRALRVHSEEDGLVHLEPGWPEEMAVRLGQGGDRIVFNDYQARVQAIGVAPDGSLTAGVDPRGGAMARATRTGEKAESQGAGNRP